MNPRHNLMSKHRPHRRSHTRRHISATDLAALGHCERKAMYRHHRYAGHEAPEVRAARKRGDAIHEQRHRELTRPSLAPDIPPVVRDPRCFIASAVYGPDAWQTIRLRQYRDQTLLPTRTGRLLVRIYYCVSPTLATWLHRAPRMARLTRWLLDTLINRLPLEADEPGKSTTLVRLSPKGNNNHVEQ